MRSDFNDAKLLSQFKEVDEMEREDRTLAKKFMQKLVENKKIEIIEIILQNIPYRNIL